MRIGFDAKWFYSGHPSGKIFATKIVEQLACFHPEHEYVFVLNSEDRRKEFPYSRENVQLRYSSLWNNLTSNLFLLPRAVRKTNLDVLVTQNFAAPFVKSKQVCVVFDIIFKSDPQYFTILEKLYFSPIRPLLRLSDAVVTISHYCEQELKNRGFVGPSQSIHVLPLAVDERFLEARQRTAEGIAAFRSNYGLPDQFVLYVGRINRRKNLENLVRAVANLDEPEIKLVICGERDWKKTHADEVAKEVGARNQVVYLGHVPDVQLPYLYCAATVFAFVSHREGFGLPALEAMACGVPVVASNTSSLPEVCGDAAEYVDPNKPEEITRALDALLTNPDLCQRRSELGRQRAGAFSWSRTADRLLEILSQVAGRH